MGSIQNPSSPSPEITPRALRHLSRKSNFNAPTAGLCPGAIQANLLILPSKYASDFLLLCERNPVPCPLLAYSATPGDPTRLRSVRGVPALIGTGSRKGVGEEEVEFDIRTDIPGYNIYRNGELVGTKGDVLEEWVSGGEEEGEAHTAFLLGCSFTFDSALSSSSFSSPSPSIPYPHNINLTPRHITAHTNVPMYATTLPLSPAGIFTSGTWVVSMRPYPLSLIPTIRSITRPYRHMHGEPIAWGWDAVERLGIRDLGVPEWGDAVVIDRQKGEVPVFWGCGVTPQNVVMNLGKEIEGSVMAHVPGWMLVCDLGVKEYLEAVEGVV